MDRRVVFEKTCHSGDAARDPSNVDKSLSCEAWGLKSWGLVAEELRGLEATGSVGEGAVEGGPRSASEHETRGETRSANQGVGGANAAKCCVPMLLLR